MDAIEEESQCESITCDKKDEDVNDISQRPKTREELHKDIFLAATYVEDARVGRLSDFIPSDDKVKFYHLYYKPIGGYIMTFVFILHALLALFEEPSLPSLATSKWVTIPIEIFILICYIARVTHIKFYTPTRRFFTDTKYVMLIILIFLSFCDLVSYIPLSKSSYGGIRWSRPLRPLFAVNFPEMRQIRRSFRNMIRTLPDVFNVLVLLFFSLAIFALMGFKLFGNRDLKWVDGRPYFENYWDSIFDLYVLITTANNPDIMMPAFNLNIWYVLFFVVFLVLCFFIYMNIILAVIYNNYRENLKNEVKLSVFNKHQQLSKSFDLISVKRAGENIVPKEIFHKLIAALPQKRSVPLIDVLWMVLDTDNTNVLDKREFFRLADLLNVEVIEVVNRSTLVSNLFPKVYDSAASKFVRKLVCTKLFQYFFDLLTLVNAVVIGISTPDSLWDDPVEWTFICLFILEILLKLYTLGGLVFFKIMWNTFDFFVIGSAFLLALVELISEGAKESRLTLDVLLVLRVLRLVKVIGSIKRFKVIFLTINKILPSLLIYGSIILVIYYMFAIIGMEIFSSLVSSAESNSTKLALFCNNAKLNGTAFWTEFYCNNNFNDLIHAFIVMFELTVVNQWHVIAYGYVAVTQPVARLYFITFHLVCVIVVLNIFTAFVLEVFMLEYCANLGRLESQVEHKIHELGLSTRCDKRRASTLSKQELASSDIDSSDEEYISRERYDLDPSKISESRKSSISLDRSHGTNVRFHISKRIRSVEVLLQKMFERELTNECQGDIEMLQQEKLDAKFDQFRRSSLAPI